MTRILAASLALVLCGAVYAGDVLRTRSVWGAPLHEPPLDSSVTMVREAAPSDLATPGTAQVLSLYQEHLIGGSSRYPWTLYVETRSDSGAASVGMTSRLRNEGDGWAAGIHSEPIAYGGGTTIGVNVEASPLGAGRVIGINVQAKNGYGDEHPGTWTNEAINIQSDIGVSYVDGIRFDGASCGTGLHFSPDSTSTRAIWIEGTHAVGIQTSAPIRMDTGVPIQLESTAQVQIVFASGRIEFRNGSRVLGWIAIDNSASGGRLN